MTIPDPAVRSPSLSNATGDERTSEATKTNCCIVGGGPAGVMLSLLLARAGVPVTLLEAHKDFDRDFRGDTIHPSTLEVLDQVGLADRRRRIMRAAGERLPLCRQNSIRDDLVDNMVCETAS